MKYICECRCCKTWCTVPTCQTRQNRWSFTRPGAAGSWRSSSSKEIGEETAYYLQLEYSGINFEAEIFREREAGLDISPMCDRFNATIEKSQVSCNFHHFHRGFIVVFFRLGSSTTLSTHCGRRGLTWSIRTPRTSLMLWKTTETGTRARFQSAPPPRQMT